MNKNLLGNFSQKKFGGPGEVSPVPPPSQWACLHLFTRVFGTNMHVLISNALFPTYVTSILKTFQSLVDGGRQATAPQWHRELMTEWPDKVVTFFLHASSCGSLGAVKYFIDGGLKPNLRYICKTHRNLITIPSLEICVQRASIEHNCLLTFSLLFFAYMWYSSDDDGKTLHVLGGPVKMTKLPSCVLLRLVMMR